MNDTDIVSAVRSALADCVGPERYDLWFGPTASLALCDGALVIEHASEFASEFVRNNFGGHLQAACRTVLGHAPIVTHRILAAGAAKIANARQTSVAPVVDAAAPSAVVASTGRRVADFANFVEGTNSRVAATSARMLVDQPESVPSLFLHGPPGVGKSHLLEALGVAVRGLRPMRRAIHLSAEQFTTYYVEACRGGSGLPNFRRKYRGVDLLLLDDVQFFEGKRGTIGELFHTVDALLRDGHQVALAADRPLPELAFLGPELTARLSAGVVCRLDPPDEATRREIVRQKAATLQLAIGDDVVDLIARRIVATARELGGAVMRLLAATQAAGATTSSESKGTASVEFAELALADLFLDVAPSLGLADIQRAVCRTFGMEAETLNSAARNAAISHPRMLAMWLARKYTRAALSEIGDFFGGRSHATVISAQKKVESWVSAGESLRFAQQNCPAAEAIRRVEAILQTRVG